MLQRNGVASKERTWPWTVLFWVLGGNRLHVDQAHLRLSSLAEPNQKWRARELVDAICVKVSLHRAGWGREKGGSRGTEWTEKQLMLRVLSDLFILAWWSFCAKQCVWENEIKGAVVT